MEPAVRRIEIVGVAGSGKSTLARTLLARHPDWRLADFIHARKPEHLRFFVHAAPGVVGFLAHALRRPLPKWDELKLFVYASEWHRYLHSRREHRSGVTLLDQGPLFALACLLWGGSGVTGSPWFRSWMRETAARWAGELDAVVELTAPDDVLLGRINEREQRHLVKGTPAREAAEVLAAHRGAYAEVLADVAASGGTPRLLCFDTSRRPLEEIVEELSDALSPNGSRVLDGPAPDAQRTIERVRSGTRDENERLGSVG